LVRLAVAEQRHRLTRCLERHAPIARASDLFGLLQPTQRLLKETGLELEPQDAPDRLVDARLGDLPVPHQRHQVVVKREVSGHHAHVHARHHSHLGRFSLVIGNVVHVHELLHVEPVADRYALKAELLAEHVLQEVRTGVGGHAVNLAGVDHDGLGARFDGLPERFQVVLTHLDVRNPRRSAVQPRLRDGIPHEMLQRTGHAGSVAHISALVAPQHTETHDVGQVRILTERFVEAGPARLPSHIEHRREIPRNARGAHVAGRYLGRLLGERRIPGGRQALILRKEHGLPRIVGAVDRVDAVQNRYTKTRLLHGRPLHLANDFRPVVDGERLSRHVQNRAHVMLYDHVA